MEEQLLDFPVPRVCPRRPPPEYEEMRRRAPLVRARFQGVPMWLVTRHETAQRVLTDARFSTDPTRPGHPFAAMAGSAVERAGQFIDMDPPEHGRYRRLVIRHLSHRHVRETRPRIQAVVDEVIDRFVHQGTGDLVELFGQPVATRVMCMLLGVPYQDHDYFHGCTKRMVESFYTGDGLAAARMELRAYIGDLVRSRYLAPGAELIDQLIRERDTKRLSDDELVGIVFLLLTAGHQTAANMLTLSVFTLLQHPHQLAELREDPGLWPCAIEELLRYHSIVDWVGFDRVALEDVELDGVTVRAGEGIFVLGASANRDEAVFASPDEFDIHRDARHHLAFGFGVHQCVGSNLARLEMEVGLRTIFDRLVNLRVGTGPDDVTFMFHARTFGMQSFKATWTS